MIEPAVFGDARGYFIDSLDFAEAYYDTVCGKVSVHWERSDGKIKLAVNTPDEIYGEIKLPFGYTFEDSRLSYKKLETGNFTVINLF